MKDTKKLSKKKYEKELKRIQLELIKLQSWIKHNNLKVIVVFEGRDAAGKGGTIKRIMQKLNPRVCRIAALPAPTKREQNQWYFQRFVQHFPASGEMVIFDRSWYNRAGVEKVMGFCDEKQLENFLETCPRFENLLIDSGIILIKYWFAVSQKEQERRLQARNDDITKRWKLGSIDIASREKWDDYSIARDIMFKHTDTEKSPWYIVQSDIKEHARLNCISHLLSQFDYNDTVRDELELAELVVEKYESKDFHTRKRVDDIAGKLIKDKD